MNETFETQDTFLAIYTKSGDFSDPNRKIFSDEFGIGLFKKGFTVDLSSKGIIGDGGKAEGIQLYYDILGSNTVIAQNLWEKISPRMSMPMDKEELTKRFGEDSIEFKALSKVNGIGDMSTGLTPLSTLTDKEKLTRDEINDIMKSWAEGLDLKDEVMAQLFPTSKSL